MLCGDLLTVYKCARIKIRKSSRRKRRRRCGGGETENRKYRKPLKKNQYENPLQE